MTELGYPFSAIVGQEEMKLALLLNAIDPRIGGVLIRGQKGTAKSTAVRALVHLLPELWVIRGCPFACDPKDPINLCATCGEAVRARQVLETARIKAPLVTLPLNVTSEMVVGGLSLEQALQMGKRRFQPGLLARANRGLLYIDEVNLLEDHIVDLILSTTASGFNLVEREGLSFWHPARFILVGTMNPEEGELRPHLMDRFGLCVQTTGEEEIEQRLQVMERRERFDRDPVEFALQYREQENDLRQQVRRAQKMLDSIVFPPALARMVSEMVLHYHVAGHRADLVIRRAGVALAAFSGRGTVTDQDLVQVARMALLHRRRHPVPEKTHPHSDAGKKDLLDQEGPEDRREREDDPAVPVTPGLPGDLHDPPLEQPSLRSSAGWQEQLFEAGEPFPVRPINQAKDRTLRRGSGRRSWTRSLRRGHYVKSVGGRQREDIAFDATIRAAAPQQRYRIPAPGLAITIHEHDIHTKIRENQIGNLLLFIVDASGSMGVESRMKAIKGAILSLLLDAYQKRDQVALISFRDQGAVLNLSPTSSVELAMKQLDQMPTGGRTPLSHGLVEGFRLLKVHLMRHRDSRPIAIIVTDGRANVPINRNLFAHQEALDIAGRMGEEKRVKYVVVDTEAGDMYFGLAAELARRLQAEHIEIADLKAQNLIDIVKKES